MPLPPICAAHLGSVERHYAELFEEAPSLAGPATWSLPAAEDDPDTLRTLAGLGFADPAAVAALVRELASWPDARDAQPAGARDPDRAGARIAAHLRRHRAPRRGAAALRPVSVAPAGGRAAVLAVPREPRIAARWSPISWPRRRCWPSSLAQRPALLDAVLTEDFLAPLPRPRRARRRACRCCSPARRRFRGHARPVAALGQRAALPGRRAAAAPRARRRGRGRRLRRHRRDRARRAAAGGRGRVRAAARAGSRAARSRSSAMGRLGSREMTLASDLDLILIYDAPPGSESSDGAQPLSVSAYYARLSQRLIGADHRADRRGARSTRSICGCGRRARPGRSRRASRISRATSAKRPGPGSIWRLTRARPVAGDSALCRRVGETIDAVLRSPARPAAPRRRRRRYAPAHRRRAPAGPRRGICKQPARRADRSRIHRAIPDAARGRDGRRRCSAATPLRRLSALGRRRSAVSRRPRTSWATALALLRQVQAVLTLLGRGRVPSTGALPSPMPPRPSRAVPARLTSPGSTRISLRQPRSVSDLVRAPGRGAGAEHPARGGRTGRRKRRA